jgi:hypothetical protein
LWIHPDRREMAGRRLRRDRDGDLVYGVSPQLCQRRPKIFTRRRHHFTRLRIEARADPWRWMGHARSANESLATRRRRLDRTASATLIGVGHTATSTVQNITDWL